VNSAGLNRACLPEVEGKGRRLPALGWLGSGSLLQCRGRATEFETKMRLRSDPTPETRENSLLGPRTGRQKEPRDTSERLGGGSGRDLEKEQAKGGDRP